MNQEIEALRKTWEHIDLVMRLLASAQIELMRRQFTHDRSKISSPEWGMFAEITHKLEIRLESPFFKEGRSQGGLRISCVN